MLYFPLHVVLNRLAECILAYKLEVFRGGVHFRPLHIGYNYKDIIATMVVHATQEHKFRELGGLALEFLQYPTTESRGVPHTHHREYHGHHGKLPILHRAMVVHMGSPGTVEGYEPRGVDRTHEDVLWDKVAFAPSEQLVAASERAQSRVSALAHAQEPVPVRVVAVFEPLVDQHVGRVVVERLADEFAHREARRLKRGVKTGLFRRRRHCREGEDRAVCRWIVGLDWATSEGGGVCEVWAN
jgi:hypothetical protein